MRGAFHPGAGNADPVSELGGLDEARFMRGSLTRQADCEEGRGFLLFRRAD